MRVGIKNFKKISFYPVSYMRFCSKIYNFVDVLDTRLLCCMAGMVVSQQGLVQEWN